MKTVLLLLVLCVAAGCGGESMPSDVAASKAASPEFVAKLEQSMEDLQLKTGAHDAAWSIGKSSWSVDQAAGTIVFTTPTGMTATAPVQMIGTYNTKDGTWLWAWDNPSIDTALREHALKVKEYGEQKKIAALTTRKINCSQEDAWELVAIACQLNNAQGAYRGPADATRVFMTFGKVKLSK
jgi:hypothetical protein